MYSLVGHLKRWLYKLQTKPNQCRKHNKARATGKRAAEIACYPHFNYFQMLVGGTSNCTHALYESFIDSRGFSTSVPIYYVWYSHGFSSDVCMRNFVHTVEPRLSEHLCSRSHSDT